MSGFAIVLLMAALLLLTVGVAQAAAYEWNVQNTEIAAVDVASPDAENCWVLAGSSQALHTSNGGATWDAQSLGAPGFMFLGIAFADAQHGWAVGPYGMVRHTSNGGEVWEAQTGRPDGDQQHLYRVTCTDALHAWAVGANGAISATSDGGETWVECDSGTSNALYDVAFANDLDGWAVGDAGTILATTDGGQSWRAVDSGVSIYLDGVACADQSHVIVVGGAGTILVSTDAGSTWSSVGPGSVMYGNPIMDVAFATASDAWAVGDAGLLYFTDDQGQTWQPQTVGTNTMNAICFSPEGMGWAAGSGVLRYGPDKTPPTSSADGLAHDCSSEWTNGQRAVTITAVDNLGGSGVATTYYTVDGGEPQTYVGAFDVAGEASHVVTYWSVDAAGNSEAPSTGYVNIDTTPPDCTVTGFAADDHSDWQGGSVSAGVSGTDAGGSGVASVKWTVDGGPVQSTGYFNSCGITVPASYSLVGWHLVSVWVVDAAGNEGTPQVGFANIDIIPPVTTATGLSASSSTGWTNKPRVVTFSATDQGGSGVDATYCDWGFFYHDPTFPWQPVTGAITISADGSTYVDYQSQDKAGNWENPTFSPVQARTTAASLGSGDVPAPWRGWVNLDSRRPTCAALANVSVRKGAVAKLPYRIADPQPGCGRANVTITVYRGRSIVKKISVRAVENKKLTCPFTVRLRPGKYTWVVRATDIAGNRQSRTGSAILTVHT